MAGPPFPGTIPENPDQPGASSPGQQNGPSGSDIRPGSTAGTGTGASPQPALPVISTPKGGGAIKGIGEKLATNPVTGTASMSIPIPLSPGRSGFGPSLSLGYDSGNGNGVWGFGWSLNTPAIMRKTDKGLPRYADADESDVFLISGAEDLVPVLNADGTRHVDTTTFPGFSVHRYRPRIEGLFARIERWVDTATGETHWRSISRDNVTMLYGRTPESRIEDGARTFQWLICESHDDRGNATVYEYVPEDDRGIEPPLPGSTVRDHVRTRYLKRIFYGNRTSRLVQADASDWMFEAVLDYAEGHLTHRPPDPGVPADAQHYYADASVDASGTWPVRPDPFSSNRAGFEIRTHRRCTAVLMFHRIPDLGPDPYLVRSTEFDYRDLVDDGQVTPEEELAHHGSTRIGSFLMSVTQSGYIRQPDGRYLRSAFPPVEFTYSKPVIDQAVHTLDDESLRNLPIGLDGALYQWVDLDGVGLPGALSAQNGTWYWKANLGSGRFGPTTQLRDAPAAVTPGTGRGHLLDLQGDGQLDATVLDGPSPGFSSRTDDGGWTPWRALSTVPTVRPDDPNLRFVDLTGDGLADILLTEADTFTWYPSLGEHGFAAGQRVAQPDDAGAGPRLVFADGEQAVYLSDMTGDGLVDLVRIRNGQVAYWPSLGYGRFGSRIILRNSPWFDHTEAFDQRRIRLADIDGSNATDIIYLGRDGVRLYINESGNRLTDPLPLRGFPPVTQFSAVQVADLLGNGTACLVWSSPAPADTRTPVRYIDLMGGIKPHLLVRSVNNLGSETAVEYAPSTRFYLDDLKAGRPWATRLPFPVHCASRVETIDRISGNRFVSRFRYAHGHFDGFEREFRGFGRVEQSDTETYPDLAQGTAATNEDEVSHVPPARTVTWYHTGVFRPGEQVAAHLAAEYYREPGLTDAEAAAMLLPDTVLPQGLDTGAQREACRALKGSILRQEVYADDGTPQAVHPYTVTEQNLTIRLLQHHGPNRHAVFLTHPLEAISRHYERTPTDPRTTHTFTLTVDDYGNVERSATVGYGRRQPDPALDPIDQATQAKTWITATQTTYTNAVDESDDHRTPVSCESRTHELTGLTLLPARDRFAFDEVQEAASTAIPLDYEQEATPGRLEKRLIEHLRTYYRRNDLSGSLPQGVLQSLALPFESYKLAFTPALVAEVYGGRVPDAVLANEGCYVHTEGDANWWLPSGQVFYSSDSGHTPVQELAHARQHFFLPHRYRDPFHNDAVSTESFVAYDAYDLLVEETRDALDNRVTAGERDAGPDQRLIRRAQDYRVLQPELVMDANRNRSAVAFDALGMVVGTAVMGKPAPAAVEGDGLDGFAPDLTHAEIDQFLADPRSPVAATLLAGATTRVIYDLTAYWREPDPAKKSPAVAATVVRETHLSDLPAGQQSKIQVSLSYSDGFGREIQKKVQAESGPVPQRDGRARIILGPDGHPLTTPHDVSPRWVGSGWTVFNNKGKPVRQYEPFFTDTHRFEFDVKIGVTPVLFYDPLERTIATLRPEHTYEKVVFTPWRHTTYDVNDTVAARGAETGDPRTDPDIRSYVTAYFAAQPADWQTWSQQRAGTELGIEEQAAATKAAVHANTPITAHFDVLGRPFLTVARNRFVRNGLTVDEIHPTRVELDIEGNQRVVRDAVEQNGDRRGRVVMRYTYDLLGHRVHWTSMDAGDRWILHDAADRPVRTWDSRGHTTRTAYDPARRPVRTLVTGADPDDPTREVLTERFVHGEQHPDGVRRNLRGRVCLQCDQAGAVTNEAYDFKGNLLGSGRRITREYRKVRDWAAADAILPDDALMAFEPVTLEAALAPALETDVYASSTTYDALNRPVNLTTPDHSVVRPAYNEANLLDQLQANLRGDRDANGLVWTAFITNIDYDAKGQRTRIVYGSGATADRHGVQTTYAYDPLTFRLTRLTTWRDARSFPDDCPKPPRTGWPGCQLQDLAYTYDPSGNITHITDDAQEAVFFRNVRVEPSCDYTYDALYRLIEATGREHLGQAGGAPLPHSCDDAGRVGLLHPGDGAAMGTYTERYAYDAVGNILQMRHRGTDPAHAGWSRTYTYAAPSLTHAAGTNNWLTHTALDPTLPPTERYHHDPHGNITRMPHLGGTDPDPNLHWDHKDQLRQVGLGGGGTVYYTYDAMGQRVHKVWEKASGLTEERLYLGGWEVFRRRHGQGEMHFERETLHVMDGTKRVALVETRTVDEAGTDPGPLQLTRYQLGNHSGSTCLETDSKGELISYEEYTPYGSTVYQAVGRALETPVRYRFAGKERDEESGFYYCNARYRAAWLTSWLSADPEGIADGLSVYVYARSNPVRFFDPTGTLSKENQSFIATTRALLSTHIEGAKADIQRLEKAVDAKIAKERGFLEAAYKKEYAKQGVRKESEADFVSKKITEYRRQELKGRGIGGHESRLADLKELKTFYENHRFSDKSILLANVITNEAGAEGQPSKVAIGYSWLNRTGGVVRAPVGSEISNYKAPEKRVAGKSHVEIDIFLGQFKDSVAAADVRLADSGGTNDPTGGATHWISPKARIFDRKTGSNAQERKIDGETRFVPQWARANNDPELGALKTGKRAILESNFREIKVKDVPGFLFYRGVK
ncbi:SpvB/TcaC N-terminal domain-containing protein [Streptomyces sp. NPDC004237]|uniref:SpvB/TcaC N-terminal domain-containing protein n=1 Tax=Streptomyces sp. NPDC004237 TaxID=3154455 RepID=UPI0033AE74AF